MLMSWRSFFNLCSILASMLFISLLLHNNANDNGQHTHPNANYLDAFAQDVIAIHMNKEGRLQNQLITPKMVHYSNDVTEFDTPYLTNHYGTHRPWTVAAEHGQAKTGFDLIELWGNVKLHKPTDSKNQELTISTNAITLYPNEEYAETPLPVTLIQPGIVINSVGVRAYLKDGRVELLSQAQGQYDPRGNTLSKS